MSEALPIAIEAEDLRVRAGSATLLRGLTFQARAGERIAIVGRNGAGKSTLLRALSGFMPVAAGRLRVFDTELAGARREPQLRRLRRRVAQVHQGLHLVGRLSAYDNVLIGAAGRCGSPLTWFRHWPEAERHGAHEALRRVGMAWAAARRVDSLSGGERQKVAIARALHQRAPMLLADEPTASLDGHTSAELMELLAELADERGVTLVCVAHDLATVVRIAKRTLVLHTGQLLADVAADQLTPAYLRDLLR